MQVVYPPITDYYSQAVIDSKITTLSGTSKSFTEASITALSGSVVSQISTKASQGYVDTRVVTTSGDLVSYIDSQISQTTTTGVTMGFSYADAYPKLMFNLPANNFVTSASTNITTTFLSAQDYSWGGTGTWLPDQFGTGTTCIRVYSPLQNGSLILKCGIKPNHGRTGTVKFKIAKSLGGNSFVLTDISPTFNTDSSSSLQIFSLVNPYIVPDDGATYYFACYTYNNGLSFSSVTGGVGLGHGGDVVGTRSTWDYSSGTNSSVCLCVNYSGFLEIGDLISSRSVSWFPLPASGTAVDPIGSNPGPDSYERAIYCNLLGSPTTGSGSVTVTYQNWKPPGVFVIGNNNITVSGGPAKWYVDGTQIINYVNTASGNLVTQLSTSLSGISGIVTTKSGNVWYVSGASISGGTSSVTLSGIGGVRTSQAGGVWYIDGSTISGGTSSSSTVSGIVVVGSGIFNGLTGCTITHNLNTLSHATIINPAGTSDFSSDLVADIGDTYIKLGQNQDVVYNTGDTTNIPFSWFAALPGTANALSQSVGSSTVLTGSGNARPAAGVSGRLYLPINGYYPSIDSGSTWTSYVNGFKCASMPAINSLTYLNPLSTTSINLVSDGDGWLLTQSGTNSSSEVNGAYITALPSAPYTFIIGMQVNFYYPGAYTRAGIYLTSSNTGNPAFITFTPTYGNNVLWLNMQKFSNFSTWSSNYIEIPMSYPMVYGTFFLKLQDDNTNRICSISSDCRNWGILHIIGRTDFITATHIGIGAGHGSTILASNYTCSQIKVFHWSLT